MEKGKDKFMRHLILQLTDTLRIVLYPFPQEYSHRELFGFWSSGPAESMPPPDPEEAVEKLIHTIRSDFVVV